MTGCCKARRQGDIHSPRDPEHTPDHLDMRSRGDSLSPEPAATQNGGYTARIRRSPITLRDRPGSLLRTRAGHCQNTVLMPGAGSGILKTWKPASARTAACAQPWVWIT
jgi:hypothetical protein